MMMILWITRGEYFSINQSLTIYAVAFGSAYNVRLSDNCNSTQRRGHSKYVTLFSPNMTPLRLCHKLSHMAKPHYEKYVRGTTPPQPYAVFILPNVAP